MARTAGMALAAAAILAAIAWGTAPLWRQPKPTERATIDFDVMMFGGTSASTGRLVEAYGDSWRGRVDDGSGTPRWLPYAYPPQAAMMYATLSHLPWPWDYIVFESLSLALFVGAIVALASPGAAFALLIAAAPTAAINLRAGQNGLFTAGLTGFAAVAWINRSTAIAGPIIGLLTIKPQVAAAGPLAMLWKGDVRGLAIAGFTAGALALAVTIACGAEVWPAFWRAGTQAAAALNDGRFPMGRMASVYTAARGMGMTPAVALATHMACLTLIAAVCTAAARHSDRTTAAGLAVLCNASVSPYLWDYDLASLSVGAAALSTVLCRRLGPIKATIFVALATIAQTTGLAWSNAGGSTSIAGLIVAPLTLMICIMTMMNRGRHEPSESMSSHGGSDRT